MPLAYRFVPLAPGGDICKKSPLGDDNTSRRANRSGLATSGPRCGRHLNDMYSVSCGADWAQGLVRPGMREEITLSVSVDPHVAKTLNTGDARLEATMVLHTARGMDNFISVNAEYRKEKPYCRARSTQTKRLSVQSAHVLPRAYNAWCGCLAPSGHSRHPQNCYQKTRRQRRRRKSCGWSLGS